MKEGYKNTELGWIPNEWGIKQLKDISEIIMGQSPDSDTYNDDGEGMPFFQGKTEFGRISPIVRKWCTKPTKIAKPLDILISVRAPVGEVNINIEEACIGRGLAAIREKNSNYKFIYYYMQSIKEKLNSSAQGSTFTAINSGDLKQLKTIVPPLKEQQKIAEILSSVDSQIDDTNKLIEKTRKLKKGLMQRLLTKGIGHKEFKMTEIGEIPVEWDIKEIGLCSDVTKLAGFEFTEYITYIEDGEIIALRALNLKNGKLDLTHIKTIDRKVSDNLLRSKLYIGDVLFSYVGTVGEVSLIEENDKYHLAPNVAKITFKEEVYPKYAIQYLMSNQLRNEIKKYITTTSQPALSMENIRKMKFAIPSVEEQRQIANILSSIDTQIDEYENKKAKLEGLKKALMQQLLTGKIRVKV